MMMALLGRNLRRTKRTKKITTTITSFIKLTKFTYSYYYESRDGKKYLIKKGKEIQKGAHTFPDFEFITLGENNKETVEKIVLRISAGNPFSNIP